MRSLLRRGQGWVLAATIGGSALVLSGCDPNVRTTMLTGLQGASTTLFTTFIQSFFESLQPNKSASQPSKNP